MFTQIRAAKITTYRRKFASYVISIIKTTFILVFILKQSQSPQLILDFWLVVKKSSNKYGARAIQTISAQLWNELPLELCELEEHGAFRKNLKTLLFKLEYALWIFSVHWFQVQIIDPVYECNYLCSSFILSSQF